MSPFLTRNSHGTLVESRTCGTSASCLGNECDNILIVPPDNAPTITIPTIAAARRPGNEGNWATWTAGIVVASSGPSVCASAVDVTSAATSLGSMILI